MRWIAPLLAVLVLAIAWPAGAAGGPVVAADGTVQLHAQRRDHRLCLRVTGLGTGALDRPCESAPRSPYAPSLLSTFDAAGVLAMAVAPQVTSVEASGRRYDTVAADGFGSRFLVVAEPGPVRLLRFYDAAGTLIGAATRDDDAIPVRGSRYAISPQGSVRLEATLEPRPLEPDRVVTRTCLRLRARRTSSGGECLRTGEGLFTTGIADPCGAAASFGGLAQPSVRFLLARLGSGRRLAIRTYLLPARFGLRVFTKVVPRGEAIRSLAAYGRAGRVIARRSLAQAPTGLPCDAGDGGVNSIFSIALHSGPGPVTSPDVLGDAGGHRLLIADGRDGALCAGLDRLGGSDCGAPPVDATYVDLQRRGPAIGGVVSADAARVELRLDDGTRVGADTATGTYSGAYSGAVRYVLVQIPAGRSVKNVVIRGADGTRLGTGTVSRPPRTTVIRRARAGRQRYAVVGRDYGDDGGDPITCLRVPNAASVFPLCEGFPAKILTVTASVTCRPRRAVAYGGLPPGVRRVQLILSDGARLPTGAIRLGASRAWLVRIPADATVRALTYHGRLPRLDAGIPRLNQVQPFRMLPATQQCGYRNLVLPTSFGGADYGRATISRKPASYSARLRSSP